MGKVINKEKTDKAKWYQATNGNPKAVVMIVHGLNNRAALMRPIAESLADTGINVFVPVLDGHAEDFVKFKNINREDWQNNVIEAYHLSLEKATKNNCSLFFIGYSLGGLLGSLLTAKKLMPKVEKMILLAPALEMTLFSSLLKPLLFFNINFNIPSRAPGNYRAHPFLPVKAYRTLFELKKQFDEGVLENINIPTLLFIDKKDELVSYKKLVAFIDKYALNNWDLKILSSKEGKGIHHMIAEPFYAGANNWQFMMQETKAFILSS
ncbi:MAG: alpha/beta fold hydrolase [Bacteroidota bacterium]